MKNRLRSGLMQNRCTFGVLREACAERKSSFKHTVASVSPASSGMASPWWYSLFLSRLAINGSQRNKFALEDVSSWHSGKTTTHFVFELLLQAKNSENFI